MKIKKLNWAGIQLEINGQIILIDAVENFKPYFPVLGNPLTPLVNFTDTVKADYILFTHLHLDHFQIIGLEYSTIPASLTPEQAFNAAKLLHAQKLIPIHYGKFTTPFYQPTDTSNAILKNFSNLINQEFQIVEDGEYLI